AAEAAVLSKEAAGKLGGLQRRRAERDAESDERSRELRAVHQQREKLRRHDVADNQVTVCLCFGEEVRPLVSVGLRLGDGDEHRGIDSRNHLRRLFRSVSAGPRSSSIHSPTLLPASSRLAMPMTLCMRSTSTALAALR